jgi:hypothetical protein
MLNRQAFFLRTGTGGPAAVSNAFSFMKSARIWQFMPVLTWQRRFTASIQDPRIQTLLTDLNTAAFVPPLVPIGKRKKSTIGTGTPMRTQPSCSAQSARLTHLTFQHAVRWLMSHRTDGHWSSTQETAWTLMALSRWMVASGELETDYEYAVSLNGVRLGGGFADAETLRTVTELSVNVTELLKDTGNRLALAVSDGPGSLYYTAHLNLWLPVDQVPALNQGIQVERSYFLQNDPTQPVTQAKVGDLLLVRITVVSPGSLHYLVGRSSATWRRSMNP